MRIISGKYAKRNLFTLKSNKTRPTSDKVKESLFNSLGQFFDGGNGNLLSGRVQHTINRGRGNSGKVGQLVGADPALRAEFLKTFGNSVFCSHKCFTSRE